MKVIIDIPDEMYDWLDNGFPTEDDYVKLWEKIRQGTPLEEELEKIKSEIKKENIKENNQSCNTCIHFKEKDESCCYECVKGIEDRYEQA